MELKSLKRQHPAILRLIFRQMVEHLTKNPAMLTFGHIHALEDLLAPGGHGVIDLPHHLRADKTKKFLELYYV